MTDEDTWSVPADWRAKAEPFRGLNTVPPRRIDPDGPSALMKILRQYRGSIRAALDTARENGLGEIADAGYAYFTSDSSAEPAGAAVVWAIVEHDMWTCCRAVAGTHAEHVEREIIDPFLDSWLLEHGLMFAAEAVVRRRELRLARLQSADRTIYTALSTVGPGDAGNRYPFDRMAQRVRAHLAAAPDDEYHAVVQRFSQLRAEPGTVWARLATSYLVPEQQDWLEADLALDGLDRDASPLQMLITAVTTPEQLTRFLMIAPPPRHYDRREQHYSMLTQLGPAAVPLIVQDFSQTDPVGRGIQWLAGILGRIPQDVAYLALLDRIDNKYVAAEVAKASDRYPRRALRLLSRRAVESSSPVVIRILRVHAHAHPELIAEHADPAAVPLLEASTRLPDASADQLPEVLTAERKGRSPKPPTWLVPALLPQIQLRESRTALPEAAAAQFITMLMAGGTEGDHPGLATVADTVDPDSLAEFTWAIFDAWQLAAYPSKSGWVLHALGRLGNDDTVRRLVPFITLWPSKSAHARALEGVNTLAAIGGEVALMHLHAIAKRARSDSLRARAAEHVEVIARARGLSDDELADRVVPHLGLSGDSTLTLNYGARHFHIGVDQEMRPSVTADGSRLRTLPKPSAADDPALAPVAYQSFRDFTKELKTVTSDQIRRFEAAMVDGRRWRAGAQRELIIEHPVLGQLARRLVWAIFDTEGTVTGSFRVETDRTLADLGDERFELPDDALVGVAHPLHLGDSLGQWRELFADYELLQPFDQLDRSLHSFTPEESASNRLSRFVDRPLATGKLYGLRQRGWELDYDRIYRRFGMSHRVSVLLDPGIHGGYRYEAEQQRIVAVELSGGEFGALDAIAASELLRQLERLAA
ncbi:DUF4132 domain-containing protein [Nocardia sp. NPDC051030]|uniref:DUF4132 domain-containing protein n=1 Tax=Nocardia sp. NPDC051030 TaxID=3155162 RepID=UPI003433823A